MPRETSDGEERTIPARLPWPDWVPPVPGFSAKIDGPVTFAYYGIQNADGTTAPEVAEFREWINTTSSLSSGPDYRECAEFVDAAGFYTWISIGYWRGDVQRYDAWSSGPEHQSFWESPARRSQTSGYFREVLQTPANRLETLYSNAGMCAGANGGVDGDSVPMTDPIQHHNYWGSMRDRIRASGTDALIPSPGASAARSASPDGRHGRVIIEGKTHLATIRSGEHYEGLAGREKEIYDAELDPYVVEGMLYLRDNPAESGCYSCRHMTETTETGDILEKKFAVAHFVSLRHLEVWSESHPSHLKIFNRFIEMAQELKGAITLRLWHEVLVTKAAEQLFEYLNCHEATGMLPYRESAFSSS
jgi:aldoxime dehydratase